MAPTDQPDDINLLRRRNRILEREMNKMKEEYTKLQDTYNSEKFRLLYEITRIFSELVDCRSRLGAKM